ncbi:MAG: hypothetical protein LC733_07550 [Actinobacteria bacterium]|nr:hypothetical protein [Actinomycetota bacterium]
MGAISEEVVRDLAGYTGTAAPVTSLYLDVDGRRYLRSRDLEPHLDALLREGRARTSSNGLSKAAIASVEADLSRMADHVRGMLHRSNTRGLALFSCTADGLWRVVELTVPVRNRVVINHTPYVRELEAVVARHERFAVLLADRQRARLFQFALGALVEKTELMDHLPRHEDDGGDLTRDQVAGQVAAATHRHLRRAAQVAFDVFREQGFDHLVLGALDEVSGALERELHPYLKERIAARLSVAFSRRASKHPDGGAGRAASSGCGGRPVPYARRRWTRWTTWWKKRSKRPWPSPAGWRSAPTTPILTSSGASAPSSGTELLIL